MATEHRATQETHRSEAESTRLKFAQEIQLWVQARLKGARISEAESWAVDGIAFQVRIPAGGFYVDFFPSFWEGVVWNTIQSTEDPSGMSGLVDLLIGNLRHSRAVLSGVGVVYLPTERSGDGRESDITCRGLSDLLRHHYPAGIRHRAQAVLQSVIDGGGWTGAAVAEAERQLEAARAYRQSGGAGAAEWAVR